MSSQFEGLQIDDALVSRFFAVFARFEYAMKASHYCTSDRWDNALPDWRALGRDLGSTIVATPDDDKRSAITFLLTTPPLVQKFIDGRLCFQEVPLNGRNDGERALDAVKRVRNNLFHGGKHTPHSPPLRDTELMRAALSVLQHCLTEDLGLASEYNH